MGVIVDVWAFPQELAEGIPDDFGPGGCRADGDSHTTCSALADAGDLRLFVQARVGDGIGATDAAAVRDAVQDAAATRAADLPDAYAAEPPEDRWAIESCPEVVSLLIAAGAVPSDAVSGAVYGTGEEVPSLDVWEGHGSVIVVSDGTNLAGVSVAPQVEPAPIDAEIALSVSLLSALAPTAG